MTKGVLLCGGSGTRLRPETYLINKHLIPVVATPMVMYPLSMLRALGVKDILIVTGRDHVGAFAEFLEDGSKYGVNLTYRVQVHAGGIAQALGLAEDFASGAPIWVLLGDNVFGRKGLPIELMWDVVGYNAMVVLARVEDNRRFGVPEIVDGRVVGIEEKPVAPKSEFAVTGLYRYPADVFEIIRHQKPSARGELEITDVNNVYVSRGEMDHITLSSFWSDCGTPDSLARTTKWFLDDPSDSFLENT